MVFFTCNACGESLKKNQVEKHYLHKCRRCEVLTCVDCHKDFPGDTYMAHTKCITEDEKYSAKGWKPKPGANKGEKKQQAWIDNLQALLADCKNSNDLDDDVKRVLDTVIQHENVPRKKQKFINFVKNIMRGIRPATIDKTWDLFEEALKPKEKETTPAQTNSEENEDEEGEEEKEEEEKVETKLGVKMFPGLGRIDGKEKKKTRKSEEKDDAAEAGNGHSEERQTKKKKNKENRSATDKATKKKRKRDLSDDDDEEKSPQKKLATSSEENQADDAATTKGQFVWEDVVEKLLKNKGEMKVNKLKKKVISEYYGHHDDSRKSHEELSAKLDKKLQKNKRFKVLKDVVKLVDSRP